MTQNSLEHNPVVVVNNASHDFFGDLDANGVVTMEKAAADLSERFDQVVILTPTDSLTAEGARVMGAMLSARVVEAPDLNEVCDDISLTDGDLVGFLGTLLDKAGVEVPESAGVVLAGHPITAAAAKGLPRIEVAHGVVKSGEIVAHEPSKWSEISGRLAVDKAHTAANWHANSILAA